MLCFLFVCVCVCVCALQPFSSSFSSSSYSSYCLDAIVRLIRFALFSVATFNHTLELLRALGFHSFCGVALFVCVLCVCVCLFVLGVVCFAYGG